MPSAGFSDWIDPWGQLVGGAVLHGVELFCRPAHALEGAAVLAGEVERDLLGGDLGERAVLGHDGEHIGHRDVIREDDAILILDGDDLHALAVAGQRIDEGGDDALIPSLLGCDDHLAFAADLGGEADLVAVVQIDAVDAARDSSLHGDIVLLGVQAHAARGDEEDRRPFLGVIGLCADEGVAVVEADRLEHRLREHIFGGGGALDVALLREEEDIPLELCGQDCDGHLALFGVLEEIAERIAGFGEFAERPVAAEAVAIAAVAEYERNFIRHDGDILCHHRILPRRGADGLIRLVEVLLEDALELAVRADVEDGRRARHADIRTLEPHLLVFLGTVRTAGDVVFLFDLEELALDDVELQFVASDDGGELLDELLELLEFLFEFEDFELSEAGEAEIEDGLCLTFGELEALPEFIAGIRRRFGGLDDLDDLVDVADGDDEPFQNMAALLCLCEIEFGTAEDHLALVVGVIRDDIEQPHELGLAARDRDHIHAERDLQIGIFEQRLVDLFDVGVALDLNDGAHARAVALVAHARDTRELFLLLLAKFRDLAKKRGLVDLIGKLVDNDELLIALALFDAHPRPQRDPALARSVGLVELVGDDDAPRREIGGGDVFRERIEGDARIIDIGDDAVDRLCEVVGRDARRKPHGDARSAVDEQVREAPGEHIGFLQRIVEVQRERDGVLIDIAQKLQGKGLEAGFGIAHCRGGVAVDRAEVAVSVDERHAHVEVLCHADHGVVDRTIAMGVVFTHAIADDTRRLLMRFIGHQAHFRHRVEDTPLDGLQPVFDAGQGAVHDDKLRIREHGLRENFLERGDKQLPLRLGGLLMLLRHLLPPSSSGSCP